MRALFYSLLTSDAFLLSVIPKERWLQQGAMDRAPKRPFAVVAFTDRPRSDIGSARPVATVWVHDDRGSYSVIDSVIHYLEKQLPNSGELEDETSRIVDIRWDASSGDLTDDGYDTNVRNVAFSFTGRK